MLNIAERVARGARLLDQVRPDWELKFDAETFDIESLESCILGQVYGDWSYGCRSLGICGDRYKQELNGFEMTETEYHSEHIASIRDNYLTAWNSEALERLRFDE